MTGYHQYKLCIDACLNAAALCTHCANACVKEDDPKMMVDCIQLSMECAALCFATAQLMSLGSATAKDLARLCAALCDRCADECSKQSSDHCLECAQACTQCADACEVV